MRTARPSRPPSALASMVAPVTVALVIGGAIVLSTALWIHHSPYHTCLRAHYQDTGVIACAEALRGVDW